MFTDIQNTDTSLYLGNDVSCLNVKVVYDYLLRKAPEKAKELFKDLPLKYAVIADPETVLTDENNWVSSDLIVQIFKNAKRILNDPEAPYHIGFESITQRDFGSLQRFFLYTFGSPKSLLHRVNHINSQFNTTKVVETVYASPRRAVVRLHWKENRVLSADICRFNRGIYAAIPTIWKLPPASITEPFCQFEGDPYCQYNIAFQPGRRPVRHFFTLFGTTKKQLLGALEEIEKGKLILKKKYDEVNTLNRELAAKLETLKAINTASNMLVSRENTDEILSTTARFVVDIMRFDRAIIMMLDETGTNLVFKYGVGANPEEIKAHLEDYTIPINKENNILARVAKEGKPTLIRDTRIAGLNRSNRILANFDVSSFVICPLMASEGIIGILGADRYLSHTKIDPKDLDDLTIFANTIAETLHKARLREEIESSYLNTVKALVRAIEEKDAYTRGHSERVAELSVLIGRELGIPEKELEYMRLACLLHDVGKIGISEAIVKSPKSLTTQEYDIIKQHPIKGAEIVRPVSFLKDYLHIIRHHHERYDGRGYPDRLAGVEIPLGARITAVADAYDAMTSTRPYRKGLPAEEAARRIYAERGAQFGPAVVDAFKRIYDRKELDGIFEIVQAQYHLV
ncbi:MAG: HD domain-containing protein [Spirochaetales bacterium]|nr:HD domain-containing protein [Spirochaetales bacterium]